LIDTGCHTSQSRRSTQHRPITAIGPFRRFRSFWQAVDEVLLPAHFRIFPTTPPHPGHEGPQVHRGWRRQRKATFQFDLIGTKLVDVIGVENPPRGR
jgi:hypothetical protein